MIFLPCSVFSAELSELYAFQYSAPDITDRDSGWDLFDYQSEFLRMGVPNENWVLSTINKDYEVRFVLLGQLVFREATNRGLCNSAPNFVFFFYTHHSKWRLR